MKKREVASQPAKEIGDLMKSMSNGELVALVYCFESFSFVGYIPLHSAPAGLKFGTFHDDDKWTTRESERLIRLPMYYGLTKKEIDAIVKAIRSFFQQ